MPVQLLVWLLPLVAALLVAPMPWKQAQLAHRITALLMAASTVLAVQVASHVLTQQRRPAPRCGR